MAVVIAAWIARFRRHPDGQVSESRGGLAFDSQSRLFFTYLLPLIPLIVLIDGVVSCWRTYTVDELKAMTEDADYEWRCSTVKGARWPLPITYFVGLPRR